MKRIVHIVAKDLRRFAWIICTWAVLLGVLRAGAWSWFTEVPWTPHAALRLQGYGMAVYWIEVGLFILLTAAVVLEDPTSGNRVFWVTRPIGTATLMCAKALALLLVTWLPLLVVEAAWLAWGGVSVGTVWTSVFAGLKNGLWLSLIVTSAAVWFGPGAGGAAFFKAIGIIAGSLVLGWVWRVAEFGSRASREVIWARIDLIVVIGWILVCAVILAHYARERTGRILFMVGIGAALALGIWIAWPWTWAERTELKAASPHAEAGISRWAVLEKPQWRAGGRLLDGNREIEIPITLLGEILEGRSALGVEACQLETEGSTKHLFAVRYEGPEAEYPGGGSLRHRYPNGRPLKTGSARFVIGVPDPILVSQSGGRGRGMDIRAGSKLVIAGTLWSVVREKKWPLDRGGNVQLERGTWLFAVERGMKRDEGIVELGIAESILRQNGQRTAFLVTETEGGSVFEPMRVEQRFDERMGGLALSRWALTFAETGFSEARSKAGSERILGGEAGTNPEASAARPTAPWSIHRIDSEVRESWCIEVDIADLGPAER